MIHIRKENPFSQWAYSAPPESPRRSLLTSYFSVIFRCRARFQRFLAQPESGSKTKTHKAAVKIFLHKCISDSTLESIFLRRDRIRRLAFGIQTIQSWQGGRETGREGERGLIAGESRFSLCSFWEGKGKKKKKSPQAEAAVELLYSKLDQVLSSHVHTKHMLSLNDR